MATKKKDKAAEANAAAKAETKKGGKKELTSEEKKAKREAMKERLKNRAPGQRPNSKQCDIIDLGGGNVAKTFAMNVRKYGVLITSVVTDKDGKVIAVSNATSPRRSTARWSRRCPEWVRKGRQPMQRMTKRTKTMRNRHTTQPNQFGHSF